MTTINETETVRRHAIASDCATGPPSPGLTMPAEPKSVAKALAVILLGTAGTGAGAVAIAAFFVSPPAPHSTVVRSDPSPVAVTPIAPPPTTMTTTVTVPPAVAGPTELAPQPGNVPAPAAGPSSTPAKPGPTIVINIPRHDTSKPSNPIDPPAQRYP